MPDPYSIVVKVESPPRGPDQQLAVSFQASECVVNQSWGLQPAAALIDWVSSSAQAAIIPTAALTIEIAGGIAAGGHTFYGICKSLVPVRSTNGNSLMQEFVDSREFLMWDVVRCAFNLRVNRIVNGTVQRRYMHILPADAAARRKTYTNAPYTGIQILDLLFNAPTVETPWQRVYHTFLNAPIYNLDCMEGRKLGQIVLEITERCGLVFTLQGARYRLVWALKGVGAIPPFPANATDLRGPGQAISGHPTRVTIVGDRNVYQVLDQPLQPDWKSGWEEFFDFNAFVRDIFLNERTDAAVAGVGAGTQYSAIDVGNDNNAGFLLARARAQTLTVGQYADLRDQRDGQGWRFRDYRRFATRARLDMPVPLYLGAVLFRAFRFPEGFGIRNVNGQVLGLNSLDLVERSLVEVTHDPSTGAMFYNVITPSQPNGYAIVQGYQVAADAFKTLNPQYFNVADWVSAQAVWQAMPFHVDDSGEGDQFVVFDEPIIRTADLISVVTIDGVAQAYPALNRAATIVSPAVRAALTFEAEQFSSVWGYGTKDDVENVSGLNGEFVLFANTGNLRELAYADGYTATEKSDAIAAPLIGRQFYYLYGGYKVEGCNGTQLTAMLDRVQVTVNTSVGIEELVDFTNERSRNVSMAPNGTALLQVEPDRDFDRRAKLSPLTAGQAELRASANQLRTEAALLLKFPKLSRTLMETFHLLMGMDAPPDVVMLQSGSPLSGLTLPVGTPLVRSLASNNPVMPSLAGVSVSQPIFMGVTVVQNERADGPVRATRNGAGNVVFARVKGPVSLNDVVGVPRDPDDGDACLSGFNLTTSPKLAVGNCLEEWNTEEVRLAQVRVSGSGGGADWHWADPKEFDLEKNYSKDEVVVVSPTNAAVTASHSDPDSLQPVFATPGTWVCVQGPTLVDDPLEEGAQVQHVPQWPLPDGLEGDLTYWWLIAVYPLEVTKCATDGELKQFLENTAQIQNPS